LWVKGRAFGKEGKGLFKREGRKKSAKSRRPRRLESTEKTKYNNKSDSLIKKKRFHSAGGEKRARREKTEKMGEAKLRGRSWRGGILSFVKKSDPPMGERGRCGVGGLGGNRERRRGGRVPIEDRTGKEKKGFPNQIWKKKEGEHLVGGGKKTGGKGGHWGGVSRRSPKREGGGVGAHKKKSERKNLSRKKRARGGGIKASAEMKEKGKPR